MTHPAPITGTLPEIDTESATISFLSLSEPERDPSSVKDSSVAKVAGARPKLPKLHLPKFSGDITRFKIFWDSFDSTIHKNPDLSEIDKFNYLRALLEGPAATTIQGRSLSEAKYTAAMELIKERYDKTKQVVAAHMDGLIRIPACSGDRAAQICAVYGKVNVHVRGLNSLRHGNRSLSCISPCDNGEITA